MPTIGYTTTGAGSDTTADNWTNEATVGAAYRYTASSGDTVTSVHTVGGADGVCEVGVYVYSGGVPTTKVGSANITVGTTDQEYSTSVSWALSAGVEYVVAIDWTASIGAVWGMHYDDPGGTNTSIGSGQDALPSTWSQSSTSSGLGTFWATVTSGAATLEPPVIASTATLFAPNVSVGPVTLAPPVIASTETLYAPEVTQPGTGLTVPFLDPTTTLFGPTLVPGAVTISPPLRSSTAVLYTPSVTQIRYPVSISGRKVLDQSGDVYLMRTFSSWAMAMHLTDAEITTALEAIRARGFNAVTVWAGGGYSLGAGWSAYTTAEHGDWWTTTPWASALSTGWQALDWVLDEALRLGMTVNVSFCGGNGTTGAGDDWEGVTDADMHQVGVDVATRYASYPNIVWHLMLDDTTTVASTRGARAEALFDGINDTEGATTRPVRWVEVNQGSSTNEQGWLNTTSVKASINCWYEYGSNSAEIAEAAYAEVTTVPVGDCEPPYDGSPHYGASMAQELRERSYTTFIEGGVLINYGHEDWWPFGGTGLYSEGLAWGDVPDHSHTVEQSHVWTLIDEYCADSTWAPDPGTFVTSGASSGSTRVAAGFSESAGLVYKPHTSSITVNLAVFTSFPSARVRWYDPTNGTFTNVGVFATTGSQVISHPGLNSGLGSDWVLVVESAAEAFLFPPVIASGATLHAPTVTPAAITLSPPAITGGTTLFTPNIVPGPRTLTVPLIAATTALFAPGLIGGDVLIDLPFIDSTAVLYEPTVFAGLFPPFISSTIELFAPSVQLGFIVTDEAAIVVITADDAVHIIRIEDDPAQVRGVYDTWPG